MRAKTRRRAPTQRSKAPSVSRDRAGGSVRALRAEIAKQLDAGMHSVRVRTSRDHGTGGRPAEFMDAAQQEVLQFQDAMTANRALVRTHAAIDAATRIEEGTHRICQACGKEIPRRRLLAVPLTRYCLPCQDAREKARRDQCWIDEVNG